MIERWRVSIPSLLFCSSLTAIKGYSCCKSNVNYVIHIDNAYTHQRKKKQKKEIYQQTNLLFYFILFSFAARFQRKYNIWTVTSATCIVWMRWLLMSIQHSPPSSSWPSYRCHLLLKNKVTRCPVQFSFPTVAFQISVVCPRAQSVTRFKGTKKKKNKDLCVSYTWIMRHYFFFALCMIGYSLFCIFSATKYKK